MVKDTEAVELRCRMTAIGDGENDLVASDSEGPTVKPRLVSVEIRINWLK